MNADETATAEAEAMLLTARRPDRYAELLAIAEDHARSHGCGLEVPTYVEGRQLAVFTRATHSTYVLEIGSGLGYTSLHIASTFGATGRLEAIEIDPVHAAILDEQARRYALNERIRVNAASPRDVIRALSGPYDLVVVTRGASGLPLMFEDMVRLVRIGGSIFAPNLERLRHGNAADTARFLELCAEDDRLLPWFPPTLDMMLAARTR